MVRTTINGVIFDTAAAPADIVHGYDAAARAALADDTLIKVRNLATKSNLPAKLTKGLQVTTYDPSSLKDPNNFFNFVSSWEATLLDIETHLKTYYMETPFTLVSLVQAKLTAAEESAYQFDLHQFLTASAAGGGNADAYTDAHGAVHARPVRPVGVTTFIQGGNILRDWHGMDLVDVLQSASNTVTYVGDPVCRQNLSWSFQYIMDCLDADLRAYVLSKISQYDPAFARSGPVAFFIVAQRMLQTSENLAQKVINGLIALRLTHFDGENVTEAIFTLRNVLKFLRFGEPNSFAPRTTLTLIYDVFRGSSISIYRAFVQQAQDIVLKDITDPEAIFDHMLLKYEELLLADRWVPTRKQKSAFVMGEPKTKTFLEADTKSGAGKGSDGPKDGDKKRPTHDKSGRKIDYIPPKNGEPHTRTRDGHTEHWCGKCGRWGSHLSDKHDEWRKNFNKNRKTKSNGGSTPAANRASTPTPRSTPRGSVTFLSAVTGNNNISLQVDPELADGIDL